MVTPQVKIPRGYELTGPFFKEISEGQRPALELKAADYLPAAKRDERMEANKVILAGTLLGFDSAGRSIPCNGLDGVDVAALGRGPVLVLTGATVIGAGAGAELVFDAGTDLKRHLIYSLLDVGATIDPTDPTLVIASVDGFGDPPSGEFLLDATRPVGYATADFFETAIEKTQLNYELQPNLTLGCDYFYEVPLTFRNTQNSVQAVSYGLGVTVIGSATYGGEALVLAADVFDGSAKTDWVNGQLLMSDHLGNHIVWTNGIDPVDQIIGRVVRKEAIALGNARKGALDKVKTVPGLNLAGNETQGVPNHLLKPHGSTTPGGLATEFGKIQAIMA